MVPIELRNALGSRYTFERELDRGGMATVYLARDTKHNRLVALKVLDSNHAASLGAERFRREIATAAQLHHPHILAVHDSGDANGHLWFTMPFVAGGSVRERLDRERRLPVSDALRITREIASALAYAHARGVIHRDIKPANVLLTEQNSVLLADFGIALDAEAGDPRLTARGMAIGTAHYMSPEQATGSATLDARSDVYSLGVVLYEMLAGQPPFTGPTPRVVTAKAIAAGPPSVRLLQSAVPEAVDVALKRALAPARADRWGSMSDFTRALELFDAPRRSPTLTLAVALGVVIGAGILFARRFIPAHDRPTQPSTVRLAVLPFECVGDSAHAYFADGVTDAVRGKLAGAPGLEVIGSTSSGLYRHTSKTPREIGEELGVRYLLEGRVRWAKGPDGTSRVRVTPELIDAGTATDKWQQPFDAPLTDVFRVQSEVADQVADQLQIALTPAAAQTVADRPTTNLTAYDAYLRGVALATAQGGPAVVRHGITLLTEAVGRDSTFALAWAALAQAQASVYLDDVPRSSLADSADRNSARALALGPYLPASHTARAAYYLTVRKDPLAGLYEDSLALALAPRDPSTLRRTGAAEAIVGRWDAAEAHMETAVRLDPRSTITAYGYGEILLLRRDYPRARAALDRALTLSPANFNVIEARMTLPILQGDLAAARAILHDVPSSVDRNALVAFVATYGDFGWVLDSSDTERLLGLGPETFQGDRASWAFALTQQYAWRGDRRRSRAYADTARIAFEAQLRDTPRDAARQATLGVTLAYLGRRAAAVREGQRAVALQPTSRDAVIGPYIEHQLARIYIILGEPEKARDLLQPLLRIPYYLSVERLRIDPNFAPLTTRARREESQPRVPR